MAPSSSLPSGVARRVVAAGLAVACVAATQLPSATADAAGVTVTSVRSGHCLDVRGAVRTPGAAVIVWSCHGGANQRWSYDAEHRLRALGDELCLAPAGSAGRGVPVVTATCSGAVEQRWRATERRALQHESSGLCLDVHGMSTAAGTRVVLWDCHGAQNQQWTSPLVDPDTSPPSAPTGLRSSDLSCSTVTLSWAATAGDRAVAAYDLFHDGQLVRSVPGSTLLQTVPVVQGVSWGWYVNARDAAGNVSQASATLVVTPPRCTVDSEAPTSPGGVTAVAAGTTVTVRWTAASDDVGVTAYDVVRDGSRAGSVASASSGGQAMSYVDSGLAGGRAYTYTVVARDGAGNLSRPSAPAVARTGSTCSTPLCAVREVSRDTDVPWGLVVLPDGAVLYSRRDAQDVVRLDPGTGATRSIGTVPGVAGSDGEGGLMGLAVAPTFEGDRWLYAMHTTATDNRIVRLRYGPDGLEPASTQVLLSGILRNKYHNGGRLRFGPDGMLYAATGDAQNGSYAQALSGVGALNGKILRLTPTGAVPADNPFGTAVWSYGHRNPQGLAFDEHGRLWEQEFGNNAQDETNLVERGRNYGWPQCEGTVSLSGDGCGAAGLTAPAMTYSTADGSCSGLAAVRGALWVACTRGARLYRHVIDGRSLTSSTQLLVGTYGRLRTVEPAADGGLWLTTTNTGDKDSIPHNSDERILHLSLDGPQAPPGP